MSSWNADRGIGQGKKNHRKKPCDCVTCDQAKPFDDGRPGIVCDYKLEACFKDCLNCEYWKCGYIRKRDYNEKRAHLVNASGCQ